MPRVFGTDGVRGLANREVTAALALDLSVAAARVITDRGDVRPSRVRPLAVVGRDPRISGQILEHAVVAGPAPPRARVPPPPGAAAPPRAPPPPPPHPAPPRPPHPPP